MKKNNKIFILLGPTASGKSEVTYRLLQKNKNMQIINCDSKQIYEQIPIITAQPEHAEIEEYDYKLYGYFSPYAHYNVENWLKDAKREIKIALENDKIPFLIGGTGFYINCLMNKMSTLPKISDEIRKEQMDLLENIGAQNYFDELSYMDKRIIGKINPNDKYRLHKAGCVFAQSGKSIFDFYEQSAISKNDEYEYDVNVLLPERELLYSNIEKRFYAMIDMGVLDEVKKVIDIPSSLPSYKSHGLPELIDFLNKKCSLDDAIQKAIQNTRNYAKRQRTWFRHQLDDCAFYSDKDSCVEMMTAKLLFC